MIKAEENKQAIADRLAEALKSTRRFYNIDHIQITTVRSESESGSYVDEYAEVYIRYNDVPYRRINITADSGIAMIEDIVKNLTK